MAHRTLWTVVLILLMSLIRLTAGHNHGIAAGSVIQRIQYTREFLLEFKPPADFKATPRIQRNFKAQSKQKRGKKGGIRQRLKKMKHRLPLPTCLLINAQSLRRKTDELAANLRFLHEYREACVLAITETWLDENIPSSDVEPSGYSVFRMDRDPDITGKFRGGGVCLLVRDEWCGSVLVRERLCTSDIELLCVSLRPYYLPREFPQLFICVVYVHPQANNAKASEEIFTLSQKLESIPPDAPKMFPG